MQHQQLTRGSSGATIQIVANLAIKVGGPRVAAQGRWLAEHPSPVVPVVIDVHDDAYMMERLWDIDHDRGYGDPLLRALVARLQEHVWSQPPVVKFDYDLHFAKVADLADEYLRPQEKIDLVTGVSVIKWDRLHACLTHGDPTLDNLMLRLDPTRPHFMNLFFPPADGEPVLIDPLPATPAVPDLRCVDVGKVLQSVHGYERVRYGDLGFNTVTQVGVEDVAATLRDENEWYAARYWHAVHLLRCFPYVGEEVRRGLRVQLREALGRL